MESLSSSTCGVCRAGAPRVEREEMGALLTQIPEWEVIEVEDVKRLQRSFTFSNFKEALSFTNRVGAIAEVADHHPAILTEWGRVTVTWWTHKIKGLHKNDFIMAAKTDTL